MKKLIIGQIKDGQLVPSKEDKGAIAKFKDGWFELKLDNTKPRTRKQNRALHVFCDKLANYLNEHGLGWREILSPEYYVEWNAGSVKEHIWRPFQKRITGKESTTELESGGEITEIHKTVMRELGEKKGVEYIPFPSECQSCHCLSGEGLNGGNHYEGCEDFNNG